MQACVYLERAFPPTIQYTSAKLWQQLKQMRGKEAEVVRRKVAAGEKGWWAHNSYLAPDPKHGEVWCLEDMVCWGTVQYGMVWYGQN